MTSVDFAASVGFPAICLAIFNNCPNPYAKAYAIAAVKLVHRGDVLAQIPYLLSNMTHWRGEQAKEIRNALKKIEVM